MDDDAPAEGTERGRPAREKGTRDPGRDDADPRSGLRGLRVLAVDDEPLILRSLERVLSRAGVVLSTCQRVETALELLADCDVVLTDFHLAVGTSSRLVSEAVKAGKPCILFSGVESRIDDLTRRNATLVIEKPFSYDALIAAFTDALKKP